MLCRAFNASRELNHKGRSVRNLGCLIVSLLNMCYFFLFCEIVRGTHHALQTGLWNSAKSYCFRGVVSHIISQRLFQKVTQDAARALPKCAGDALVTIKVRLFRENLFWVECASKTTVFHKSLSLPFFMDQVIQAAETPCRLGYWGAT